jgi:anti-sigma B factor antagonist
MSEQITIQVTAADSWTILSVSGEIDIASAAALREAIEHALGSGNRGLVMDLDGVSFMDSSGLNVLAGAAKRMDPGCFRVAVGPRHIRKVLEITGTDQLIPTFSTVHEATATPLEDVF